MDFYFYAGGTWTCFGGGSRNGTFPHDQWFDLVIDVDFDTDTWKIYIDGNLQATFTNTAPISYLDLYEVSSNSEWFMDDVTFCVNNGCNPELKVENLQLTPTGIDPILDGGLVVYPNPNNGVFTLSISGMQHLSSITMYTVDGKVVKNLAIEEIHNGQMEVDSSDLKAGVYLLKVQAGNGTWTNRVVVE